MVTASGPTFLVRVTLKNYRSIKSCSVSLGPLNFLVGPNGAGKGNFLDGLRFVSDALNATLGQAIRDRGGMDEIRRRSGGHPNTFGVRLDFRLPSGGHGHYSFTVGAKPRGAFEVKEEECRFANGTGDEHSYRIFEGEVYGLKGAAPKPSPDRLYLVAISGLPHFRQVFDPLSRMGFYKLNPGEMRHPQQSDPGEMLARDGWNLASVMGELASHEPETKRRIEEYLESVTPGITGVDRKSLGTMQTLEFRRRVTGASGPWRLPATSMSDGTLRALGVLAALFQPRDGSAVRVSLVGIEEPEIALHPAAAGVLLAALTEAARKVQVVVTSHSPDLLDSEEIPAASILAVRAEKGVTVMGPVDAAGREALMRRMFTAGELLRTDQLLPDIAQRANREPKLFGSVEQ